MKDFPSVPRADDAPPDLFERGHLWIQEQPDGAPLRFQLRESGLIRFGDRTRVFRDDVPEAYRHAVRHVRERLDRTALREAVGDPESVVFFGAAMHKRTIDYDWDRTPSVLGFDVWSASRGAFLPPDSVEKIYRRLDLDPVHAFEKEVRAVDFDPEEYEIPESNWYDGPAAGVVVRNKTGDRAEISHSRLEQTEGSETPDSSADAALPSAASAEDLAEQYATDRRFEKIASELRDRDRPVTFDALYERVVDDIVREQHDRLFDDAADLDFGAFRSEIAARTNRFLGEGG
ncbi:hypothetical protein [Halorussus amylolyticus]|uniref:hypothetical protein n=1 Tax=Halorussus amylolyticus TaxID=1126242 RepID=UPI00138F530C|nr:hypothetical protein [Halorussus amylolyticus]